MTRSMNRAFAPAFDADEPGALVFLPSPRSQEVRRDAAASAAAWKTPESLAEVLRSQSLARGPKVLENIAALGRPGTVAVVTGQQAGLFGGPLFTTYKIATAVSAARAFEAETGRPTVPVFWLQDEDHDFAEIAECFVPTPAGPPLRLALEDDGARVSVAHRRLGPDVLTILDAMERALGDFADAPSVAAELRRHYAPGRGVGEAFAGFIGSLFDDYGVVIVDSRDSGLARLAAPVHRRCLEGAERLATLLGARATALEAAGFGVQVHVRPGAPLCFFHPDGPEGPRYRLEPKTGGYGLVGRPGAIFQRSEILGALERDPRAVSNSALLRPLVQDFLLPTAAIVAGPGELAYFAQIPPLYEALGRPMPAVVPRARFRLLEERSRRLLGELGLTPNDTLLPRADLLRRLADRDQSIPSPDRVSARLADPFKAALAELRPVAHSIDPALGVTADKLEAAVRDAIQRFVQRYERARQARDQLSVERLDRVLALLVPDGQPQERVHSLPYYLGRYSSGIIGKIVDGVVPWTGRLQDIEL